MPTPLCCVGIAQRSVRPPEHVINVSTTTQLTIGLAATVAFAIVVELIPVVGGLVWIGVAGVLMIVALVRGQRLPLAFRAFATGVFFYHGYSMCLHGRTMEPGFTRYTVSMALTYFAMFALSPGISLIRIWRPRPGVSLLGLLFSVSFGAAALVAGFEEHFFISKYRDTGIGPTARWTVSHHWLSYDREARRLDGSD